MKIFALLLCCTVALAANAPSEDQVQARVTTGATYNGKIITNSSGKKILAFTNVTYATPQTGVNMFREAIPVQLNGQNIDATGVAPACAGLPHLGKPISFNCLSMDIYVPSLSPGQSRSSPSDLLPVLVYFPSNEYDASFGSSSGFSPELALNNNLILIIVNYRLGPWGYLSSGNSFAPGNAGLKDQVLALRFVKNNIASFGGNSNKITIAGHGIGGVSVSLHLLSPLSRGLFNNAIALSGAISPVNLLPNNQLSLSAKFAELLQCPSDLSVQTYECLSKKSPQEFSNIYPDLYKLYGQAASFAPVIESNFGQHIYLSKQPQQYLEQFESIYSVPLVTGAAVHDYGYLALPAEEQAISGNKEWYNYINEKWEEVAPIQFNYENGTSKSNIISQELKNYFFPNHDQLGAGDYDAFRILYSIALTYYPNYKFVNAWAQRSSKSVFKYNFNLPISNSYKKFSNGSQAGIFNTDLPILLFKPEGYSQFTPVELEYSQKLWNLITNFIISGAPMKQNQVDERTPVYWGKYTVSNPQYYELSQVSQMISGNAYQPHLNKFDQLFASNAAWSTDN